MTHQIVIDQIVSVLRNVTAIRGLFLSGSYGNGQADRHSDIDFLLVTDEGATDAVSDLWRQAVDRTGEVVLWWDRVTRPALINAITADWVRTDVVILKPQQMLTHTQDAVKPLFDHDGLYEQLPKKARQNPPDPARVGYQIEEFIRILGLLPLAVGREEYLTGVLGMYHMRNLLVDLLIAETDAPFRGGALHLNRLITEEQKQLLSALPTPVPTRDGVIAGNLAYAAAYLPRARAFAAGLGLDWPERFEEVTWQRLEDTLAIKRPVPGK